MGRQGALAQYLRALFGQKDTFTVYFSGKGRSLLHLNTAQRSIFFSHYNLFLEKLKEILPRKARLNTERVIVLMPPGHAIILLACEQVYCTHFRHPYDERLLLVDRQE